MSGAEIVEKYKKHIRSSLEFDYYEKLAEMIDNAIAEAKNEVQEKIAHSIEEQLSYSDADDETDRKVTDVLFKTIAQIRELKL